MMYSNKIAVAIKHNGKVLREVGDQVFLPFGSEYSILVKNLNTVRASVKIAIDGNDATEDISLIIKPNSSLELERFVKNGNMAEGNRFKFIERSAAVEAHRGVGCEDGLIRVETTFERVVQQYYPNVQWTNTINHGPCFSAAGWGGASKGSSLGAPRGLVAGSTPTSFDSGVSASYDAGESVLLSSNSLGGSHSAVSSDDIAAVINAISTNTAGVTAAGSVSDQEFHAVSSFPLEGTSTAIILKLLGFREGQVISQPVTVKTKTACNMCGTKSQFGTKFCPNCGAGLQIV
jgi:hypothetical protein